MDHRRPAKKSNNQHQSSIIILTKPIQTEDSLYPEEIFACVVGVYLPCQSTLLLSMVSIVWFIMKYTVNKYSIFAHV